MHEWSIAHEILETVRRHLPVNGSGTVRNVKLKLGTFNRIAPSSLRECFELLSRGTSVQGATLEIEEASGYEIRVIEFDLNDEP